MVTVYLVFKSVLQGWGEVCRVDSAVVVDVGSKPEQQVDQVIVSQTQRDLRRHVDWMNNLMVPSQTESKDTQLYVFSYS